MIWLLVAAVHTDACAVSPTGPVELSREIGTGGRHQGIRLLGALRMPAATVDGLALGGLSGLAWDESAGLLYAISDKARLFHIRPIFAGGLLVDAQFVAAYRLRDASGRFLRPPFTDAEDIVLDEGERDEAGKGLLVISFESRPRIARYTPTGEWRGDEPLPPPLRNRRRYAEPNKSLEALALHPNRGLLTAPEWPLRDATADEVPLYSLRQPAPWSYPLYPAPNSALVAMTALPDGSLLTLERAFVSPLHPLIIALRRAHLGSPPRITVDDVAVFDSRQGWLLDNFEGLTRHRGQRFFMVSDDNFSLLQSTLLVYFELLEETPAGT